MFFKAPAEMIGKYHPECVVLYALMYSRLLLSVNNPKFRGENGQAFIHFSVSEVRHVLMMSDNPYRITSIYGEQYLHEECLMFVQDTVGCNDEEFDQYFCT